MRDTASPRAWLGLPAVLFVGVLFLLPVLQLLWQSVLQTDADGAVAFTLERYVRFFADPYGPTLLMRTLWLSTCTVVLSLALAFPVAVYLRSLPPARRTLIAVLLLSPLLTSVVVRTLAWVVFLGPKGLLNTLLLNLGLEPMELIYNNTGVVIGLTHVYFGYMLLCLMTVVLKLDPEQFLAAANLGAGPWRRWWHVMLPQCRGGIAAGSVLVFSMSASAYVTPVLLGGTQTKTMATEIYDLAISYLEWKEAAVAATVLLLATGAVVAVLTRAGRETALHKEVS